MNVFWNHGESRVTGNLLSCDRCRDGPGLNLDATPFFRRIQQKLAAAKINGSRPFAHTKNSLFAKACDRLILESQLTAGRTPVRTAVPWRTLSFTAAARGAAFDGST